MKMIKLRRFICKLLLSAGLLLGTYVQGQTFERSRLVSESFAVNKDTEIQIINKYGNVHIIPWEKDSVRFDISLEVSSTKQAKLDKTFDFIDFDFRTSKYYVIAQTEFEGKAAFWTEVTDLASTLFTSGTKTQIDYTVYLPATNYLKVDLKFGNIYATDHQGKIQLNLSNGDLKAHALTGDTQLELEFGSATINQLSEGKLTSRYAEVTIDSCGKLDIESKSTQFTIDHAATLKLQSYRDRIFVNKVANISGSTSVSETRIEHISNKVDLKTNYGDIRIEGFGSRENSCTLNTTYTDATLYFEKQMTYAVDISYTDRTNISYPADLNVPTSEKEEGEKERQKVQFVIGGGKKESIPVRIHATDGNLFLRMK